MLQYTLLVGSAQAQIISKWVLFNFKLGGYIAPEGDAVIFNFKS